MRSLHFDVDASSPEALLDVSWAFLGPGALLRGTPAPDGLFVDPEHPTSASAQDRRGAHAARPALPPQGRPSGGGVPARRRAPDRYDLDVGAVWEGPSPLEHAARLRPVWGGPVRPALPRPPLRLSLPSLLLPGQSRPALPAPSPRRAPVPRPAPPQMRVRQDGVRVVARPLAMLPGVDLGRALRLDLHPVPEGIVFVSRHLELRELGDDVKGIVLTGVVPVAQLERFWSTVADGLPEGRPVIVRLRSDVDSELLDLLRVLAPAGLPVVSYRLDESPVGSQRSSYLLPDVDAAAVAATGEVRVPLETLRAAHQASQEVERTSRVFLSRRRVDRFLRRSLPQVLHSFSFTDPADLTEIYVDGSVLRGTRTGGAAAVGRSGPWAAQAIPGATLPLEAELEALALGHLMAAWSGSADEPVVIRSDSRAALALLRDADRERLTLGDARGERIRRSLRRLLATVDLAAEAGTHVSTVWVKGHAGTRGNELADDVARSAARNTAAGVSPEDLRHRIGRIIHLWDTAFADTLGRPGTSPAAG